MKLPRTRVEPAKIEHLEYLIRHSEASKWANAEEIITHKIKVGLAWTGFARMPEGWRMAAMWGLLPKTLCGDEAWMWFIATDLIHRNPYIFVRHARRIFAEALTHYPKITACVEDGNEKAKRFLTWLGAEIGEIDSAQKFEQPVRTVIMPGVPK